MFIPSRDYFPLFSPFFPNSSRSNPKLFSFSSLYTYLNTPCRKPPFQYSLPRVFFPHVSPLFLQMVKLVWGFFVSVENFIRYDTQDSPIRSRLCVGFVLVRRPISSPPFPGMVLHITTRCHTTSNSLQVALMLDTKITDGFL